MPAPDIMHAKNTITQKLIDGSGIITVELDLPHMMAGQKAGLTYLGSGKNENWLGIHKTEAGCQVEAVTTGINRHGPEIKCDTVWLRTEYNFTGITRFLFSLNGIDFHDLGGECELSAGFWKGARIGLFTYQDIGEGGFVDFNWFRYEHDGPAVIKG